MILSFADKDTERIAQRHPVPRFRQFERVALRKLAMLAAATSLHDLRGVGNQLEALTGNLAGLHSIRITGQWRLVFRWEAGDAYDVRIMDYH